MYVQTMNYPYIPASHIFSFWIFFWALLYLGATAGNIYKPVVRFFNPSLALLIALIWTCSSWIWMALRGYSWGRLAKYGAMILTIKVIPLIYTLKTWEQQHFERDVLVLAAVFGLYNLYLFLQGTTYEKEYQDLKDSLEADDNRTPLYYWVSKKGNLRFPSIKCSK
jgi:hypothetical protein